MSWRVETKGEIDGWPDTRPDADACHVVTGGACCARAGDDGEAAKTAASDAARKKLLLMLRKHDAAMLALPLTDRSAWRSDSMQVPASQHAPTLHEEMPVQ